MSIKKHLKHTYGIKKCSFTLLFTFKMTQVGTMSSNQVELLYITIRTIKILNTHTLPLPDSIVFEKQKTTGRIKKIISPPSS